MRGWRMAELGWAPALDWMRASNGYRIIERAPDEPVWPAESAGKDPWHIAANEGELVPYSLADLNQPLCVTFASLGKEAGNPGAYVAFANQFGLPADQSEEREIPVARFQWQVIRLRWAVSRIMSGQVEGIFSGRRPTELSLTPGAQSLQVKMASLQDYLWLEALQVAQAGLRIGTCPICGDFMIMKSEQRQFCTDTCRQKAHRRRG
jgi:hypothetical protein